MKTQEPAHQVVFISPVQLQDAKVFRQSEGTFIRYKQCSKYKQQRATRLDGFIEVIVEEVGAAIFQNSIPACYTAGG